MLKEQKYIPSPFHLEAQTSKTKALGVLCSLWYLGESPRLPQLLLDSEECQPVFTFLCEQLTLSSHGVSFACALPLRSLPSVDVQIYPLYNTSHSVRVYRD